MSLVVEPGNQFETTISIRNIVEIVPNDSTVLTNATKAIYVAATATVKLDTVGGQTVTLVGLASGIWHPIQATKIYSTGTSLASVMGSW
jgi:hypothetical protein